MNTIDEIWAYIQRAGPDDSSTPLEERFQCAAAAVKQTNPTAMQKLIIYGLYKQSTLGDVTTRRPGLLDRIGCAKWDSWKALQGATMIQAKLAYINLVERLLVQGHGGTGAGTGYGEAAAAATIEAPSASVRRKDGGGDVSRPMSAATDTGSGTRTRLTQGNEPPHSNTMGFDDQTAPIAVNITANASTTAHANATAIATATDDVTVRFHKKHTFSTKNNPLCGITLLPWVSILRSYISKVEWQYYPRLVPTV